MHEAKYSGGNYDGPYGWRCRELLKRLILKHVPKESLHRSEALLWMRDGEPCGSVTYGYGLTSKKTIEIQEDYILDEYASLVWSTR